MSGGEETGTVRGVLERAGERARGWLRDASRSALANGSVVADEGDRWFVAAVRTLDRGAQRAERGFDSVAGTVFAQLARLRPRWTHKQTPRERIESVLHKEARRLHFDADEEQFRAFVEKIAIVIELVFTRAVPLDDVAFEHAPGSPADGASSEGPALAHSGEEVAEAEKRDEGDAGQPVDW